MSSYSELSPFLVEAFLNVTQRQFGFTFTNMRISLKEERGAISLSSAIAYVQNWHGADLPSFTHAIFVEAEELRWRLSNEAL